MNAFAWGQAVAWIASAMLGIWLVVDLLRTNHRYSEDVLMSSREGEIEDELVIDPTQGVGR